MYADRMSAGTKRLARDRLHGTPDADYAPSPLLPAKRQRQSDDRWKHDLFEDERPQVSSNLCFYFLVYCLRSSFIDKNFGRMVGFQDLKVGPRDLRLKLQKKVFQETHQIRNAVQGVKDLREKLSGTMHSQPAKADPPRVKVVAEPTKLAKKSLVDVPARTQKVANASLSKKTQPKADKSAVDGFLQSLGLEKYLITFQAEEIDMTALMHMTDGDLKALGIPMGPRKKILLALDAKS